MSSRSLRVGVLLGDSLVEERVFSAGSPVSIGQSLRCDLSIPAEGVPHDHVLFAVDQGRMLLRVTEKMIGRIAHQGAIKTELRTGASDDGVWSLPIEPGARGRIQLGDATILFQELATPPKSPRPQLPASVRGGQQVDRRLAAVIGGSILAHCAVAVFAWMGDLAVKSAPELEPSVAMSQEEYSTTAPEIDPNEPSVPGAATPVSPTQTATPIVPGVKIRTPGSTRPSMPEPDAAYWAKVLSGGNETPGGQRDMQNRRPGADLDKQIDHIKDTNGRIEVGTPDGGFRPQEEARPGTTDGPNIQSPTNVTKIPKEDTEQKKPRIVIKPVKQVPTTTLSVDTVLSKIMSNYMPGLQRCYKKGLAGDASLGGTVDVAFTVGENGAVMDPSASGLEPVVDNCIQGQMSTWRFPIPRDKAGNPDEASFQVALALEPS